MQIPTIITESRITIVFLISFTLIIVVGAWWFLGDNEQISITWGQEGIDDNDDGFMDRLVAVNLNDFCEQLYQALSPLGYSGLNPLLKRMRNFTPETLRNLQMVWNNYYSNKGIGGTEIWGIGSLQQAISSEYCTFLISELDCTLRDEIIYLLQQNY